MDPRRLRIEVCTSFLVWIDKEVKYVVKNPLVIIGGFGVLSLQEDLEY
jgi:hypothetical protein